MKPNVVIVVVDALRTDRVGAFGGRDLTPRIDSFASDAARFTRAFSTTNTTDPAVTSIQTGRYPLSSGVLNHGTRVTAGEKTAIERVPQLPAVLSNAGYDTGKFGRPLGRWHRTGFDIYPSEMETETAFDARETDESVDLKSTANEILSRIHPSVRDAAAAIYNRAATEQDRADGYLDPDHGDTDEVVANFEAFLDSAEPFYAFVHLMNTHVPYYADSELVASYLERFDYEVRPAPGHADKVPQGFHDRVIAGEFPRIREKYYFDDEPSTAIIEAHYDAAVTESDQRVGTIIETLTDRELLDDTLVVVLADHGESLTEHGIYYEHHGLYDCSIHVPLLIRPPGGADRTVEEFVQITDIAPTVTAYTDTPGLEPDGQSLDGLITGDDTSIREYVMAEEAHTQRRRMIRTPEEKLIYLLEGNTICRYCDIEHAPSEELYDLTTDPVERVNRADERPERVAELRTRATELADALRANRPDGSDEESIEYDDEAIVEERLRSLGYR